MEKAVTEKTPPPPPAARRPHGDLRERIKEETTSSSSVSASPSPTKPPSWVQDDATLDVWKMIDKNPTKEEPPPVPPPVSVPQPGGSDDVPLGPSGSTP